MKTVDLLKAATGAACLVFALGAQAQTATDNNTSTTTPDTAATDSGTRHHMADHTTTHESASQGLSDGTITTKVKADLLTTKNLTSTHIHVKTRHGKVRLSGTVPSSEEKTMAADVAKSVNGVKSVSNHLKVVSE